MFNYDTINAKEERFEALKAMNTLIKMVNDERVYMSWIYVIPDEADDEELLDIAENDSEIYRDAAELFKKLMKSNAVQRDGLYIGGEVY